MFVPSIIFREHLEHKYKNCFSQIPIDDDIKDLFNALSDYIDVNVYAQLLSFIDMWDFHNFERYFSVVLSKYHSPNVMITDITMIHDNPLLQVFCILCLQYYFL